MRLLHEIRVPPSLLRITRERATGRQHYYIDGLETSVNGYLRVVAKHESAREARLRLRPSVQ